MPLLSKGLWTVFSNTTLWKHQFFGTHFFFMIQLSRLQIFYGKTITLTIWCFVDKVMTLLFNMLSRFVIAFLPRSNRILISRLQTTSALILEPKKIKFFTVSTFPPSVCHEVMGLDAINLAFWMLSFKLAFSLFSSALINRLFSSSLLSVLRVVSTAYLRLLIFLPVILIPACESSSLVLHMMYSA